MVMCPKETFLFVHGAWHGGWCWENIEAPLQERGYVTLAPDLPAHGKRAEPLAEQTLDTYADDVVLLLDKQSEPVILVGHSMGGAVITQAAEKRPEKVKKLVYLAAFMLRPGQSVNGLDNGIRPIDLMARSADGKTVGWSEKQVVAFTPDCTQAVKARLYPRLCPEAIAPLVTGVQPTPERWGRLRRFYIACDDDAAATPEAVKEMLESNPCEKVYSIHADHLAFYSAPKDVIRILDEIARIQ